MKTVGIILRRWYTDIRKKEIYGFEIHLLKMLRKYKEINVIAIPVEFSQKGEWNKIRAIIDICDGIILPGGKHIEPIDFQITKYLYEVDKPTLGICLGMQIIARTFNGNVGKVIDTKNHNSDEDYVHEVKIDKNSKLYEIIQKDIIKVNSRHNTCVPFSDLDKIAYSVEENIIEAVEDKEKRFFMGIQWHPETLLEDENSKKIFDAYIESL